LASRAVLVATAMGSGMALLAVVTGDPPFFATIGLAALVGLLVGGPLGAAQGLLARRSGRLRLCFWLGAGAAWGEYLAFEIGIFTRAGHQALRLALVALLAGAGGAFSFGALLGALQPCGDRAPMFRKKLARFFAIGLASIIALVVATYELSTWWLRSYPGLRLALISASWLLMAAALALSLELLPERPRKGTALGWVALSCPSLAFALAAPPEPLFGAPSLEHLVRLVRRLTDVDRDGFSSLFGGGDCAPFDPNVHPGAREIPDNGIDDNCRHGDAKRAPTLRREENPVSTPPTINVLLVTIDALRADHTSAYGYARDTTPRLRALAEQGRLFENAYTSGGWTCIALPSLFAGVWARKISTQMVALTNRLTLLELPWEPKLLPGETFGMMLTVPHRTPRWMLHEALRARGFRTAAAYAAPLSHLVESLGGGWDAHAVGPKTSDSQVVDAALARLAEIGDHPFFLWVHLYSPHEPQTDHEGVPTYGTTIVDRYDHEVAAADRELGRLVDAVDAIESRATAIIVAADHGEAFEWGFQFHGNDLFEEGIRIPLIVRAPGASPRRVSFPASLVDVAPTILSLTGANVPAGLDGDDLTQIDRERPVLTDLWRLDQRGEAYLDQVVATDASYHLALDRLTQETSLSRVGDLRRPPKRLSLSQAPARLKEALGAYLEYTEGGP
jgi:hypothetical protein